MECSLSEAFKKLPWNNSPWNWATWNDLLHIQLAKANMRQDKSDNPNDRGLPFARDPDMFSGKTVKAQALCLHLLYEKIHLQNTI